jgi:O-acetylserine/cysteine efflux transporter
MPITHFLLVLLVVVIWGVNFIFVKLGLDEVSPLLLCAVRFFLASVPAVFFIKPPALPFKTVAAYGIFMFALQFGFVFMGMSVGMTPGMASLIMQVQVFFSMFFAAFLLGEQPGALQIVGALIAFSGIGVVAFHLDQNISLFGFLFILAASACWGVGNLMAKKLQASNLIAVIVWGSLIICPPMFLASYLLEGPESFTYAYYHLTWQGVGSIAYIVYASTWLGYGIWNWLLGRYPVSLIVPFTLLVPVVGMLSSIFVFSEPFQLWKLIACLLVITGLCVNILSTRLQRIRVRPEAA